VSRKRRRNRKREATTENICTNPQIYGIEGYLKFELFIGLTSSTKSNLVSILIFFDVLPEEIPFCGLI